MENVITDYASASLPKSDIAKAIAATASGKKGSLKAVANGRSDLLKLNPYDIHILEGWNCRNMESPENIQSIDELAKSIAVNGVQRPLDVFMLDEVVYVSDGHRRLLATFRAIETYGADIKSVPALPEGRGVSVAERKAHQITANSGVPLTPFEMGANMKDLVKLGWTEEQIAKRVGLGVPRVIQLIELQAVPTTVATLITEGKVSASLAHQLMKESPSDKALENTLTTAVANAEKAGKSRATKKHLANQEMTLSEAKKTIRAVRAFFETMSERGKVDNSSTDKIILECTPEEFVAIVERVGGHI